MALLRAFAALVLFVELPVPLYWFVLHPFGSFWRTRPGKGLLTAAVLAWTTGGILLWRFREAVLSDSSPAAWAIVSAFLLIGFEAWMLVRVHRELGGARMAGETELLGEGELAQTGLYAHVRHPRYAAMFGAVVGACLLAGTRLAWKVAAVWALLVLLSILLEERELRARFGAAYEEYSRRVPRFLPVRFRRRGPRE